MDLDELRLIMSNSNVDVWTFIATAIAVAATDYRDELKNRRDGIVELLYSNSGVRCFNCETYDHRPVSNGLEPTTTLHERHRSPITDDRIRQAIVVGDSPQSPKSNRQDDDDEDDLDPYGGLFDDEQTKILDIKRHLEDPDQSEENLVDLLQSLADMDITFKALQETDIGRNVNRLRKHSSSEVKRLVKQLIRKWKETVDEWVKLNQPEVGSSTLMDVESPQQHMPRHPHNGHHQVPDFAYSPNPHTGSSGSDKNYAEIVEPKSKTVPRRDPPTKPTHPVHHPVSAPPLNRPNKDSSIDQERLNSARRRLHESYQEAENAKKQRTIQVMDIHDIPKPKNTFFAKNKGGFQGRHHR